MRRKNAIDVTRPRKRRRKRKTALAMSAAVATVGTAAYDLAQPSAASAISAPMEREVARTFADKLTVSPALMETIAEEEGVHLTVYADPKGNPTVGVGHLVRASDNLSIGDTITYDKALLLLQQDLKAAEASVAQLVGDLPLYQHEFDALVDLVFNVGEGTVSQERSPALNAAIEAGNYAEIAAELAYHNAGSTQLRGLAFRSDRRQAIFDHGNYADPRPANLALRSDQILTEARA